MVAMEMICDSHICGCGLAESLVSYVNGTLRGLPLPLAQVSLQKGHWRQRVSLLAFT